MPGQRAAVTPEAQKEHKPPTLSAYANYWVALLNGRVVGIGRTAKEALSAARSERPKEEPSLVWVPLEQCKS